MATAQMAPARAAGQGNSNTISLKPGESDTFALKFAEGKNIGDSEYPPFRPRFMFSATDDRKLFLSDEDADDLVHGMRDKGIQAGEMMRVTNHKLPNRAHAIRVERANGDTPAPAETKLEADLRASIEASERAKREVTRSGNGQALSARENMAPIADPVRAPVRNGAGTGQAAPVQGSSHGDGNVQPLNHSAAPPAPASAHMQITPMAAKLCAALKSAIDSVIEATAYGARLGMELQFTEEDIRALAVTMFISADRSAT
jgi:hypothetical protein